MECVQTETAVGAETLYAVIGAIADGPDLERVLRAVVDLLVHATACHACFIYLREGDRLRIRAASPIFAHVVGRVSLEMGEGLTGWVARHRTPAFIKEDALRDPRMKYVPELDEERFQSMVAVPLVGRHGDAIGVVVLHTEAPREFGQDVVDLLTHVASLVAGAIDNARLYEATQRRVVALSALSTLSQELASLTSHDALYAVGCDGIRTLLGADSCRLLMFDAHGAPVEAARSPAGGGGEPEALLHAPARGRLTSQLLGAERPIGAVHVSREEPFADDDAHLLQTATNQLALALRTAKRIERLASENVTRDVLDALERGRPAVAANRAASAGWDPSHPYVAVVATPFASGMRAWTERVADEVHQRLRGLSNRALIEESTDRVLALLPLSGMAPLAQFRDELATLGRQLAVCFGLSRTHAALVDDAAVAEASDAVRVCRSLTPEGGVRTYDELGPYRFLVPLIGAEVPDKVHARALDVLAEYDRRRHAALVDTLDAYLDARGASRATAQTLVIHPNTLRQRLERIEQLTGLRLADEDFLSLQLSLKVHRLGTVASSA